MTDIRLSDRRAALEQSQQASLPGMVSSGGGGGGGTNLPSPSDKLLVAPDRDRRAGQEPSVHQLSTTQTHGHAHGHAYGHAHQHSSSTPWPGPTNVSATAPAGAAVAQPAPCCAIL